MPLKVQLFYPEQPAQSCVLFEGKEYLFGRAEDCDVVLAGESVSRYHARVASRNGVWQLHDHNSQNGCFTDGKRVQSVALARQAELVIGDVICRFQQVPHRQVTAESSFQQWRSLFVHKAAAQMMEQTQLTELLDAATETLATILSSDRSAAIFLDHAGDISRCSGYPNWLNADSFTGSRSAIAQAVATQQPIVLSSVVEHPSLAAADSIVRHGIQALLCFPIVFQGNVVAVLYADSNIEHRAFLDTDLVIVRAFARQLTIALQIQDIEERLRHLQVS